MISAPADEITLVLADGQHFFREGLRGVLEAAGAKVIGEAADRERALELVSQLQPQAVVIDSTMHRRGGEIGSILRELTNASPETRLIVLGHSTEPAAVRDALESGACAYLLREAAAEELAKGFSTPLDGQVLLSRTVALALGGSSGEGATVPARDVPRLTSRELDVLGLIVQGANNAEIGEQLSISQHTAKRHVRNLCVKLGVRSRVEAAVYAVRNGLA